MTPNAIAAASRKALLRASFVRIRGMFDEHGQTWRLNMELVANSSGKATFSKDGFSINVLLVGRYVYFQASAASLKHFGYAAFAKHYGGVWIKASATTGSAATYGTLMNKTKLFDLDSHSAHVLVRGPRTTINGQAAVTITDKTSGMTVYVAAKGTPFPLEVKSRNPVETLLLGGYGQPASVVAPAHSVNGA